MARFQAAICLLLICCTFSLARAQGDAANTGLIKLDQWKFQKGDDPLWAGKDFDDAGWSTLNIDQPLNSSSFDYGKLLWLRTAIPPLKDPQKKSYALQITQLGSSEIYLNGNRIKNLGAINSGGNSENFNPHNRPIPIQLDSGKNVIAIRFAPDSPGSKWVKKRTPVPLLRVQIQPMENALSNWEEHQDQLKLGVGVRMISAVFSLLFLMLFIFFPKEILYLFYGLFNLFLVIITILNSFQEYGQYSLETRALLGSLSVLTSRLIGMSVLLFIFHALSRMRPLVWWYVGFILLVDFPLTLIMPPGYMMVSNGFRALIFFMCAWLAYHAFRSEKKENILVGILACTVMMVNSRFIIETYWKVEAAPIFDTLPPVITTFSIITYLAIRNRNMHKDLERHLVQVQELSESNLRKEQEKQQILSSQNEKLEKEVEERTASLNLQKKELLTTLAELKSAQSQLIQAEKMASLG
ncbi:MAG TPA: hypothetical protein VFX73_04240, partial [Chitinophagaceae bacterium]|nr:hypothetical protein [Chitinophagaceae bacterium]